MNISFTKHGAATVSHQFLQLKDGIALSYNKYDVQKQRFHPHLPIPIIFKASKLCMKTAFKHLILFALFTIHYSLFTARAQQFGGNPSSVKWRQINTDTVRIIFPQGLDSTANRISSVVHELQKNHHHTMGGTLRKIDIVLQNQNTLSNAYVGLGPYRSEFYLMAPQNNFELGTLNWADNLALHEYRHVQQYSNFNVGITKVLSVLFGQEGQAVANAAAVPDWFFEGDAVFNETALSNNGRGRLPNFFKDYQSLLYADKNYSYTKLRNGSLRHFVPGHYELGYMLVAYGRQQYGADVWKKITQDAAAFKPLIYPFQGAVKKHTGKPYHQFVDDAFQFYQAQWKEKRQPDVQWLTRIHKNNITDYRYPYNTTDGKLIASKRSYRQVPAFIKIDDAGKEEKIGMRDIAYDDYYSYNNGKIIYAILQPHSRWGYKEYSNLKLLDAETHQLTTITHNQRYFVPDISHNGHTIAAVEMLPDQVSNLVVLNINGEKLITHRGKAGEVFTYPKFSADDQAIYTAVRNRNGQMALQKWSATDSNAATVDLLPFAERVIGFPVVQGDTVFFSSSYQGADETWAYLEKPASLYRVATYPTGLYGAVFDRRSNRLIASAFTAEGYRLAAFPAATLIWQKMATAENAMPDLYNTAALNQENNETLNSIPQRSFVVSKYSKLTKPFNFHSWRPTYDEPEVSLTFFGQNILNTLRTELYYTFNKNEHYHEVGGNAIYGAWYVQPVIGLSQTWQRNILYNADTSFFFNELNGYAGLQLPLNFSGGKQYRYLTLSSTFNTQKVTWTGLGKRLLRDQAFNYLQARLVYSSQIQKAIQHIYPRWAHSFSLQYRTILNNYTARQFLATGSIYLPGIHSTHNIILTGAYHGRDTLNQYLFSNSFPFSRGYRGIDFPRMWRFGANYHFPLVYPDWGFGNIVYFKRIRANGFYDYTQTKSLRTGTKFLFSTAGAEIYFDTKWWNQQDVTFGFRYSRLLDREYRTATRPNHFEIILPVNLFSN